MSNNNTRFRLTFIFFTALRISSRIWQFRHGIRLRSHCDRGMKLGNLLVIKVHVTRLRRKLARIFWANSMAFLSHPGSNIPLTHRCGTVMITDATMTFNRYPALFLSRYPRYTLFDFDQGTRQFVFLVPPKGTIACHDAFIVGLLRTTQNTKKIHVQPHDFLIDGQLS